MDDIWFFLSYARFDLVEDPNETVKKFYQDLNREMRQRKGISEGRAGFFDSTSIKQGEQWPETLVEALCKSRTLLCLYSPSYFNSEYCGKELAVFRERLKVASRDKGKHYPLIIPILLEAPYTFSESLPSCIEDIQYANDDYPKIYQEEGLRYLFKRKKNHELELAYEDFLNVLVKKLIYAANLYNLPPHTTIPDIKTVKSAFHQQSCKQRKPGQTLEHFGPRYADFIYVAGKQNEIEPLRRSTENYGIEGGPDWKPYLPGYTYKDEVCLISQSVATKESFRYEKVDLEKNINNLIEDAREKNKIVIIIVDNWTLLLKEYYTIMKKHDEFNFRNCAVLIVTNDKDADTLEKRSELEEALQKAFHFKAKMENTPYFIKNIESPDDLKKRLSFALQGVKANLINTTEVPKKIETEPQIEQPKISGTKGV